MARRKIYTQPPPEPTRREVWVNKATAASFALGAALGALAAVLL